MNSFTSLIIIKCILVNCKFHVYTFNNNSVLISIVADVVDTVWDCKSCRLIQLVALSNCNELEIIGGQKVLGFANCKILSLTNSKICKQTRCINSVRDFERHYIQYVES